MTKKALITGITGQDGAYLSQLLISKGWKVYGGRRRGSTDTGWRLKELGIDENIEFVPFELLESSNINETVRDIKPDAIYNLAAHSFVGLSFMQPHYTTEVNALGPLKILEAIRNFQPECRFYQASSSEMFGSVAEIPQTETTPLRPLSPYGSAKALAHWNTVNYRDAYNMFCVSGMLFNHESPLRGIEFVTRKISAFFAAYLQFPDIPPLKLGNIHARRDWGYARDYVYGMYLMMTQDKAEDFVLAMGKMYSVKEFVNFVASAANVELVWDDYNTRAVDRKNNNTIILIDHELIRKNDIDILVGDAKNARTKLGWKPAITCGELAAIMFEEDYNRIKRGHFLQ